MKTLFSDKVRRMLIEAMTMPPQGFLEGSVYKDTVYVGSKRRLSTGHSLKPEGGSEFGIYVTPSMRYARMYGHNIGKAFVSLKHPLIVENKGEISPTDLTADDARRLKRQGHDGIISTSSTIERATEFVLFDSKQVWIFEVV